MKAVAKLTKLFLFANVLVLLTPQFVSAQLYSDGVGGFLNSTYFEDVYVGNGANYNWINSGAHGSYSITGSVMPNWQSGSTTGGGGAVGTKALGVAPSESNSQVLKQALFDYLYRSNTNQLNAANTAAGRWDTMGSALVVHTMLGERFTDGGRDRSRSISAADWAELRARLVNNPDIRMSRQYYNARENTAGVMVGPGYNTFDAARYTYDPGQIGNRDSWVFRDGSGAIVYVMEMVCANPLGNFAGLPPAESDSYDLWPSANSNGATVVEPGGQIRVDGVVENRGEDASPGNEWRLIEAVYPPGRNPGPAGGMNAADPCNYFIPADPACREVEGGTNVVFPEGRAISVRDDYVYSVPETAEVGTKICFAVSVRPPTNLPGDQARWRHSSLHCVIVAKSPKVQVWGGDIRSGGKIDTSLRTFSSAGPLTFGSWGEYGVFSKEGNSGFASGAGLNDGDPNPTQSSWSRLTFANTGGGAGCSFGCYNFTLSSGGLVSQFISQSSTPAVSGTIALNDLASGTYRAGNITLSGSTITAGKTIVLVATGTVTIDGSITYEDRTYTDIRDIPQVVIKAPVINIRNSAGQVDAWLLAVHPGSDTISNTEDDNGVLNTCSDVAVTANLSATTCDNPLTIHGPVVADVVHLRRTAGSGSQPNERGDPAEIFNLRADAYLWAHTYSAGSSRVQTVYTKELSPRY